MARISLFFLVFCLSGVSSLLAQSSMWSEEVELTYVNVRGNPYVAASLTVNLNAPGKVIVSFDGMCTSVVGDLIVLAASNHPDWDVNDGNVGVRAFSADNDTNPFSHTRVYDAPAGQNTFYAIAQNYVYLGGSGIASIYGTLTVEYIPASSGHIVQSAGIAVSDVDVKTAPVALAQISINPATAGKAIVKFNGSCYADVGDRIVLAASNIPNWAPAAGNVTIEVAGGSNDNSNFSHTRVYDIPAGAHTFYAIAHNFVETDGNGKAGIYGSLTVEFVPAASPHQVLSQSINQTNVDVEGAPIVMGLLTINAPEAGKVLVAFNGTGLADVGDRIVLGVNDEPDWNPAPASVSVEAINSDVDRQSFSTVRFFDVAPGAHNFYAVVENYVEQDGNGMASVYGNFMVRFFPGSVSSAKENAFGDTHMEISPNPTSGHVWVQAPALKGYIDTWVSDVTGKVRMQSSRPAAEEGRYELDLSALPAGTYFLTVSDGAQLVTKSIVKR